MTPLCYKVDKWCCHHPLCWPLWYSASQKMLGWCVFLCFVSALQHNGLFFLTVFLILDSNWSFVSVLKIRQKAKSTQTKLKNTNITAVHEWQSITFKKASMDSRRWVCAEKCGTFWEICHLNMKLVWAFWSFKASFWAHCLALQYPLLHSLSLLW